jgi:hypothetical protein
MQGVEIVPASGQRSPMAPSPRMSTKKQSTFKMKKPGSMAVAASKLKQHSGHFESSNQAVEEEGAMAPEPERETDLHHACKQLDVPRVRELLRADASGVNAVWEGKSPLMMVVEANARADPRLEGGALNDLITCLIEHGASKEARDHDGFTALQLAVMEVAALDSDEYYHTPVLAAFEALTRAGCDTSVKTVQSSPDTGVEQGWDLLCLLAFEAETDVDEEFLSIAEQLMDKHGFDPCDIEGGWQQRPSGGAEQQTGNGADDDDVRAFLCNTPLYLAASAPGCPNLVEVMMHKIENPKSAEPVKHAFMTAAGESEHEIVGIMIKHGVPTTTEHLLAALQVDSATDATITTAELLLREGIQPGHTHLEAAWTAGGTAPVELGMMLLQACAPVNFLLQGLVHRTPTARDKKQQVKDIILKTYTRLDLTDLLASFEIVFRYRPLLALKNGIWLATNLGTAAKRYRTRDALLATKFSSRAHEAQLTLVCLLHTFSNVRDNEWDEHDALDWLLSGESDELDWGEFPAFAFGKKFGRENPLKHLLTDAVNNNLKEIVRMPEMQVRLDQMWHGEMLYELTRETRGGLRYSARLVATVFLTILQLPVMLLLAVIPGSINTINRIGFTDVCLGPLCFDEERSPSFFNWDSNRFIVLNTPLFKFFISTVFDTAFSICLVWLPPPCDLVADPSTTTCLVRPSPSTAFSGANPFAILLAAWSLTNICTELGELYEAGLMAELSSLFVSGQNSKYFANVWNRLDLPAHSLGLIAMVLYLMAPDAANGGASYLHMAFGVASYAVLLLLLRLARVLTTFSTFGPLVLMVFQMCVDVARFAVILALVIGAFSSSLFVLGKTPEYQLCLGDEPNVLTMLFHTPLTGEVPLSCLAAEGSLEAYVTEVIYTVIVVWLLLNMLIAMMAKSFDVVWDASEVNYLLSRSQLILTWADASPVPPPLNLLSLPYMVLYKLYQLVKATCCCFCKEAKGEAKSHKAAMAEADVAAISPTMSFSTADSARKRACEASSARAASSKSLLVPPTPPPSPPGAGLARENSLGLGQLVSAELGGEGTADGGGLGRLRGLSGWEYDGTRSADRERGMSMQTESHNESQRFSYALSEAEPDERARRARDAAIDEDGDSGALEEALGTKRVEVIKARNKAYTFEEAVEKLENLFADQDDDAVPEESWRKMVYRKMGQRHTVVTEQFKTTHEQIASLSHRMGQIDAKLDKLLSLRQ